MTFAAMSEGSYGSFMKATRETYWWRFLSCSATLETSVHSTPELAILISCVGSEISAEPAHWGEVEAASGNTGYGRLSSPGFTLMANSPIGNIQDANWQPNDDHHPVEGGVMFLISCSNRQLRNTSMAICRHEKFQACINAINDPITTLKRDRHCRASIGD